MDWNVVSVALIVLAAHCQANHLNRDESREEDRTQFNLASTLTGDITSSRHHQRANLNAHLYPESVQPGGVRYGTADIDEPHGHESGARAVLDVRGIRPGGPLPKPLAYPQASQPSGYPSVSGAYPAPTNAYPAEASAPYPVYPAAYPVPPQYGAVQPVYPGLYLPQYPGYPQPPPAIYPGAYGPAPPPAAPATSYQNHQRFPPHSAQSPDHWDHSLTLNTEYKEDGVHKGPFDVLNNHNAFGFGSGYGGGYNGAFNSGYA